MTCRERCPEGLLPQTLDAAATQVHRVECHFECHSAGKIGKRMQTDANAGNNWQTLNR